MRAFIHAEDVAEIIFDARTTESINLVAASWGRAESDGGGCGGGQPSRASLEYCAVADGVHAAGWGGAEGDTD